LVLDTKTQWRGIYRGHSFETGLVKITKTLQNLL
jgi:hypothetical protein